MIIKDEAILRKTHPNYVDEIEIIEKVFGYFIKLVDENLIDYLADNHRVIHKKTIFFQVS